MIRRACFSRFAFAIVAGVFVVMLASLSAPTAAGTTSWLNVNRSFFEALAFGTRPKSLASCDFLCAQWRSGAYTATVLSARDNSALVAAARQRGGFSGLLLGAQREKDNAPSGSREFRWVRGPLRAASGGKGALFYTTSATFRVGFCAPGWYCGFVSPQPNNLNINQTSISLLCSFGVGTWDDINVGSVADSFDFDGCGCRWDATLTASLSAAVTKSASSASVSEQRGSETLTVESLSVTRASPVRPTCSATDSLSSATSGSASISNAASTTRTLSFVVTFSGVVHELSLSATRTTTTTTTATAESRSRGPPSSATLKPFSWRTLPSTSSVPSAGVVTSTTTKVLPLCASNSVCSLVSVAAANPRSHRSDTIWQGHHPTHSPSVEIVVPPYDLLFEDAPNPNLDLSLLLSCGSLQVLDVFLMHSDSCYSLTFNQTRAAGSVVDLRLSLDNMTRGLGWQTVTPASPYRESAIRLLVLATSACGSVHNYSVTVRVLPMQQSQVVGSAKEAGLALQWVSALSLGSTGAVVGRSVAALRVLWCTTAAGSSGGLLGLSMPRDADRDDGTIAFARGAVVGNLMAALATGCVLAAGGGLYARVGHRSLRDGMRVALPSSLLPIWTATVQSTSEAVPLLIVASSSGDWTLAVLGIAQVILPLGLLAVAPHLVVRKWAAERTEAPECGIRTPARGMRPFLASVWRRLSERRCKWRSATNALSLRCMWCVLCDHRLLWFCAADALVLAVTAALSSVGGLGSPELCRAAAIGMLLLYVGELMVCALLQPYSVPLTNVFVSSMLLLAAVSLAVQVAAVVVTPSGEVVAESFVSASTVLLLISFVVSGLKFLFLDCVGVAQAC